MERAAKKWLRFRRPSDVLGGLLQKPKLELQPGASVVPAGWQSLAADAAALCFEPDVWSLVCWYAARGLLACAAPLPSPPHFASTPPPPRSWLLQCGGCGYVVNCRSGPLQWKRCLLPLLAFPIPRSPVASARLQSGVESWGRRGSCGLQRKDRGEQMVLIRRMGRGEGKKGEGQTSLQPPGIPTRRLAFEAPLWL